MSGPASPLQVWLVGSVRRSKVPQTELATRAGMSQKHVSQMLTGRVEGSLTAWSKLLIAAEALRIEVTPNESTEPVDTEPEIHQSGELSSAGTSPEETPLNP